MNRRNFVKKSLTLVLPIVAAIALMGERVMANSTNTSDCKGMCKSNCANSCNNRCLGSCYESHCKGSCAHTCYLKCYGSCSKTCKHSTKSDLDSLKIKQDTIIIKHE